MSDKKGQVWMKCGRCHGTGTVARTTGPAITCPECGGVGSRKVGVVKKEKSLETNEPIPGQFVIEIDQAVDIDINDFQIVISMIPLHLPLSRRTGRPLALYDEHLTPSTDFIACRESKISVKLARGYVTIGDVADLDEACPEHQHVNTYGMEQEILEPCEWDETDEVQATTIHASLPVDQR
jgi:hypothetical protein